MARKIDPREDAIVPLDLAAMALEFKEGKPVGETARIPVLTENFSWKSGFINVWTGWPNDGKTTFFQFMALMKSVVDGWKWCFWPAEMLNAIKGPNGKMVTSASDVIDELVFMKTGRNPYKHFEQRYGVKQMDLELYLEEVQWVNDHFIVINPKDKKYKSMLDNFRFIYENYGVSGFLVDPFKNMDHSEANGRFDLYLDEVFSATKEFALETNTSFNYIAHPKAQADPKNSDGSYKVCDQFMLAGGAAWNNNMDGIYSIYRTMKHASPTDPRVSFFNLKQRKQQLVGRAGVYNKIEFEFLTNRYYFDGYCPIDGTYKEPIELKLQRAREQAKRNTEGDKLKESAKKGKKPTTMSLPAVRFEEATFDFVKPEDEDKPIF